MIHIPFGMRCNTATIIRINLQLQNQSMPFDWVQMTPRSMGLWIENLVTPGFLETYFSSFSKISKKNHLGDWFPHDEFDDTMINKYSRRCARLHSLLTSEEDKTLYILNGSPDSPGTDVIYESLLKMNMNVKKMVTINMALLAPVQTNFDIPVQNWDNWETEVTEIIASMLF